MMLKLTCELSKMAQSYKEVWSEEKSTYVHTVQRILSCFVSSLIFFTSPHLVCCLFCLSLFSDFCYLIFSLFHSVFEILSLSFLQLFFFTLSTYFTPFLFHSLDLTPSHSLFTLTSPLFFSKNPQ
jgi:hypothetical protein